MIDPLLDVLPDGRHWLRVADTGWDDPLDPSYAQRHGGRWNPPGSFPTLYLNEDLHTARAQIIHMLEGFPVDPEDLDAPYVLVTVSLPRSQITADAVTDAGLGRLGLPSTYPMFDDGLVSHNKCRPIGAAVKLAGLRGVHARSAATLDGAGRELAWFPARASSKARRVSSDRSFADWWYPGANG
ncbi:MAG: RES family NAD+ phosphorylase [Actinomycetota bacterium]|nr:RES family NAD+ phosphorylase [Actinomycetota bacterium]